jgi:hypothetical protein
MLLDSASHAILYALPLVLIVLPLLAGRYPGELTLVRRAPSTCRSVRLRGPVPSRPRATRTRLVPRGGLLVACAMAVRPPPLGVANP